MKTLKKLFSVSAIVALLGTLAPMYAFAAGNSLDLDPEFPEAYAYAYKYGVTTQSTDNVDMGGKLTRIAMAKMIAKYAKNVLNLEEAENAGACTFVDVTAALDAQYDNGVTEACKLGLMGQNMPENKFRPNDLVTRAEFGTTLSRALNRAAGTTIEEGTPYYEKHLKYLNEKGIMKVISDPNMLEVRGYVMLMMMRADENHTEGAEGCSAEELLACITADNYDACIAACNGNEPGEEEQVKKGTLTAKVTDYSSEVKSAPAVGTVIFNSIKFSASEDVTVNNVTLSRIGLSNRKDIDKIWFEQNGTRISSKASVDTAGKASVTFTNGLKVKSNETVDLVVALSGTAGSEVAFTVDSINSTADKTNIDVTTTTYRTTNYNVASVDFQTGTVQNLIYKLGEATDYVFGKFTLDNTAMNNGEEKDVVVKSIMLKASADADDTLTDVKLYRDGKVVSENAKLNGNYLVITLNDTIQANKRANYSIHANIAGLQDTSATITFSLKSVEDVVVYEESTNFRATVPAAAKGRECGTYTIMGGKVTLLNESTFATSIEAGQGSTEVQIAEGTLNLAEGVVFDLDLVANATGVRALVLEIAGSRYTADINTAGTGFSFDDIYVTRLSSKVKLYASLAADATGTIVFYHIMGSAISNGEYQSNGTSFNGSDVAGTIKIAKVIVKTPKFSLRNDSSATKSVVVKDPVITNIFEGSMLSNKGTVSVSDFVVTVETGTFVGTDNIQLTLYVNGNPVGIQTFKSTSLTGTFVSNTALTADPVSVKIEALPTMNNTGNFVFSVVANGTDEQNNPTVSNEAKSVKLSIVDAPSATISSSAQGSLVRKDGTNAEISTFDVFVKNGNLALTNVDLTGVALPTNYSLYIDGNSVDTNGLNETLTPGNHTFTIKANINSTTSTGGLSMTLSGVTLDFDGGITANGNLNATYLFVKVLPEVTVQNSGVADQVTLRIALPADAENAITLTQLNGTGKLSVNNQHEAFNTGLNNPITITPSRYVDIVVEATSTISTANLDGIVYTTTIDGTTYTYTVDTKYTNYPWATFKSKWVH